MGSTRPFHALAPLLLASVFGCADLLDIPSTRRLEVGDAALPSGGECQVASDCAARGDYHVCRGAPTAGRCVSLKSPDCDFVFGDHANSNAVFIGTLAPTKGETSSIGLGIQYSVRLAAEEFHGTTRGLPPTAGSSERRPLVIVGCNDADAPLRAATHLVHTVGVPVIIGSAFSGITIEEFTKVVRGGGTMMISPSATSTALSAQEDDGLLWRTAPSDVLQSQALTKLVPLIEADVRATLALPPTVPIRVAIAHKGDAYGSGLARGIGSSLTFNGKSALDQANEQYYRIINYGEPTGADASAAVASTVVPRLIEFQPHIVLSLGTVESILGVLLPTEQNWPAGLARPRWLLPDGGLLPELRTGVRDNEELRKRILGTIPATDGPLFRQYRASYSALFPDSSTSSPDTLGAASGYDALYMVAYAMASQTGPLTGASVAAGVARLVPPGKEIAVGPESIGQAFASLGKGEQIDLSGASGPLDFDLQIGEAPSDIRIWCLPKDAQSTAAASATGCFLDAHGVLTSPQGPGVCTIDPNVCGFTLGG